MEDGTDARAFLAKAAATFTVLSLLPVALSGSAPSHASAALRPISLLSSGGTPVGEVSWSTSLFASFTYQHGVVFGTYAEFGYNATMGTLQSLIGLEGQTPVLYLESIDVGGFPPARSAAARGPIFEGDGYLVTITAHDDPTALIEIRSDMARLVTVELPPLAKNISLVTAPGSWRTSSVSFVVQGEEARLFLGAGSFNVTGTTVLAHLASPDLLVFKSVPAGSTNKAEWRAVLDAISAGHVVAELDLVAIADGGWMQNPGRYRIDVAAWPLAVRAGQASVQVDTLRPGGAVVLLAFDPDTMPVADPMRLSVSANGGPVNRSNDTLSLFYAPDSLTKDASYSILSLPGTVIALYLPSLAAVSVNVVSVPRPAPTPAFDSGSEAAVVAALAIVSVAAARMLRRRDE
jgi:hypothetical protein